MGVVTQLAGPFFACCLLLAAAGLIKCARPGTTVLALRSVGIRVPGWLVRVGGGAESALGLAALLAGGGLAIAVAASYAAFAGFVLIALRRGGVVSSCGCFGKADTPPTVTHIAVNAAAATACLGYGLGAAAGLPTVASVQPLGGVPLLLLVGVCGWLGYALLAVLPSVRRPGAAT